MMRTIILEAAGHQSIHPLALESGRRFSAECAVSLGQFSQPVRVLIQHSDRQASGILKIRGDQIGLPPRRLIRTPTALKATWPPVDLPGRGLTTVTLMVTGKLPPEKPRPARPVRGIKAQRARLHNLQQRKKK